MAEALAELRSKAESGKGLWGLLGALRLVCCGASALAAGIHLGAAVGHALAVLAAGVITTAHIALVLLLAAVWDVLAIPA